jgi:hypothetical protein
LNPFVPSTISAIIGHPILNSFQGLTPSRTSPVYNIKVKTQTQTEGKFYYKKKHTDMVILFRSLGMAFLSIKK